MTTSIYDAMGGSESVRALAQAWHRRCLADEVVSHAFSHPGQHPDHLERLTAYWGEALGGPPVYTETMANQQHVVVLHSGNGIHTEMDDRAIACFVTALDDVGITDELLRTTLADYFRWSTHALAEHPDAAADVPDTVPVPHWSWSGPVG
ncbi:group II truncated hemoglobin [Subtercola endophyticus]|uniref:group II truncated hemoglobin n=1 Tax=Subtercola endophyticus TaxID=2895559 RepID=UPI001E5C79DE|nr:group II truncated hemoglobin [Subtercola endophyticus]UFS60204.1 group II truncated hemoglobin [Subtercola endophyticus]